MGTVTQPHTAEATHTAQLAQQAQAYRALRDDAAREAQQAQPSVLEAAHAAYRAALAHELHEHAKLQGVIQHGGALSVTFDAYVAAAHETTRALQALTVALGLEWIA